MQSCTVYQITPVTLEESIDKGKIKYISATGEVSHFDKIEFMDSVYYGLDIPYRIPLDIEENAMVYLKNKKGSATKSIGTVTLATGGVALAALILIAITVDFE